MRRHRHPVPVGTALGLVVVLSAAGCGGADRPSPETTSVPEAVGQVDALVPVYPEAEHGAPLPTLAGGMFTAAVPQPRPGEASYRSEAFWSQDGALPLRLQEGDELNCTLDITPRLGDAATRPGQWTVLWQLQGPLTDGSWPGPPLSLHVSSGSWHFGGGAGRQDGREAYAPNRVPYVDGQRVTWRIAVKVSSDATTGQVDAWLGDERVVDAWHPPSGTRYPTQSWLGVRSGIYAGTTADGQLGTDPQLVVGPPLACSVKDHTLQEILNPPTTT